MQGTAYYNRNIFDRLSAALNAYKGLPSPGQLYPPQQGIQTGYLTFPGWQYLESHSGQDRDEARVKKAVQSTSVFANMRAIATEFSAAEIVVKERKGDKWEEVPGHPLEERWNGPNEDLGRAFVMAFWAWSYTMTGKAFLYWLPAGGEIKELWPIPPFMIKPIPATKEFVGGYAFRSAADKPAMIIPREYITYSHSPNLFDIRDGLSFLVAAMTPIESEIAMGFWNRNFFDEQNGIPDGLISLSRDALDVDVNRVRSELRDFFGGTKRGVGVARAGDMEYTAWGRSQKDAEFVEGIKLASTQIGRTMGFPDGYWSESANRANAEQARATMIAGAVWPLLVALHEDMNAGVVKRWYGEQYRAEFKDIRPEDRELKIKEQESRKSHWLINELREADGKDPLDDPRGLMLVAEIPKGTPIPATPAAEMTDEYVQAQEDEVAKLEAEAGVEEEPTEETTEGGPPATEEAPIGEGEEAPMPTKAEDLDRWERKALKSLRRFKTADVRFTSLSIPLDVQSRVSVALKSAQTAEDVKRAFKAADDADPLIDSEWAGALEWARRAGE